MSLTNNISKPESVLKKKNNAVCYHTVCESVVMGETLTAHIEKVMNTTDLLAKVVCMAKGGI